MSTLPPQYPPKKKLQLKVPLTRLTCRHIENHFNMGCERTPKDKMLQTEIFHSFWLLESKGEIQTCLTTWCECSGRDLLHFKGWKLHLRDERSCTRSKCYRVQPSGAIIQTQLEGNSLKAEHLNVRIRWW